MTTKPARFEMAHDALGGDGGHARVSLTHPLATFEPESKGNGVGKVAWLGGRELVSHAVGGYKTD